MNILITGATGFIGKRVVKLLEPHIKTIYILVRKESAQKAKHTFKNFDKIHFVEGDILSNDVVAKVEDINLLSMEVDHVLHLAAKYDLTMGVLEAYTHNVIGVQNVLTLARKLKNLEYFHHVSTYAVNGAGAGVGRIKEKDLLPKVSFPDHYSKSKKQGEHLVRAMEIEGVKKRIYRPGIVVGDSKTGEIEKVDGPYYFFKFLQKIEKYHPLLEKAGVLPMPYGAKTIFPVIPVDVLSEWIAHAVLNPSADHELKCYHFIGERQPTMKEFLDMSLPAFGLKCSVKRIGAIPFLSSALPKIGMPQELMPYMLMEASYDVSERLKDFPEHREYNIAHIIKPLIEGARKKFKEGVL